MKRKLLLTFFSAIVLVVAAYGFYVAGKNQGMKDTAPSANSVPTAPQNAGAEKKVLYWHDPMVPGQKFDKPGKSPFMDMQLVPVYAGADDDQGGVTINSRVQQNLGIRTAEVTIGRLTQTVEAVGSVAYNERDVAVVQSRSNGYVERLYARAPLDSVKQGQALLRLYVPEWIAAQEEYFTVKRMRDSGLQDSARQRMRLAGMSDVQITVVETSGKVEPHLTVTAPISGVVTELSVREGMTVMAGAPLFRINGTGNIWINAEIPENLAASVDIGHPVEARVASLPGTIFTGKVSALLPELNAETRTLKARIELNRPHPPLVPGVFVTVRLITNPGKDVLLVPSEAVIQTGARNIVMVVEGQGKFSPVNVEIGPESNGQTEIRRGLTAGQKVVVSGQFLLDSEASLKGISGSPSALAPENMPPPANDIHRGTGKIERLSANEITLSHGPIPSLNWGPMTMGFKLPAQVQRKNLAVGDTVNFAMRKAPDGMYEITAIDTTNTATSKAGAPK